MTCPREELGLGADGGGPPDEAQGGSTPQPQQASIERGGSVATIAAPAKAVGMVTVRYVPADTVWDPSPVTPLDLDASVIRHIGVEDGWTPGQAPVAVVRGTGHPSHVRINGWPYLYVGSTESGDTLYESY